MKQRKVALAKGRLADKAIALFEKAGYDVSGLVEDSRMLIFENKSILGSVGGGLAESKVIEKGCEIIGSGKAFLFHFVMDADVAARAGMACGGTFDILIEDVKF